ncbi:hypothetical protein HMPREF9004_0639 [Schaalia cardiffensis F0333]|uniref:Uncharacterized protein n=1 Tax=Schaalia cardiffensis F0333 TaxID=888050 RepID=N6W7R0_9ACTO|nr:hypothetical protein [Schaalia cardiffensis]ENO18590.1 hypothetical protein HMPREF9004_0639 [Schaalia cardiffensis F0333]
MALLIHIAGDSDLGIARGGLHPYERRRIQKGRLNELEELSDPEQIARRLLEMNYDVAVEEKRRGVDVNPDQEQSTPMEKAFQGLKELKKTGPLQVLIVGTADGEGGTERIARVLARQLKELRSRCSIELGEVTPLVLRSLAEKDWLVEMEQAMQDSAAEGEVILPIAGGSTAIVLGVAGAAIASGRDLSMLLAKLQPEQLHPRKSQQAQLYPLKISADPIRGWLLGLGLPTLLGDEYQDDGQVRQAAASVERAFAEKVTVDQRADALGQLLLMDVARGDLAAGMSIRAWHDAEMKRPNDQGGSKCLMSAALEEAGKSATHDFAALMDGEAAEKTRLRVLAAVGVHAVPDFLSWPNEHVCLICSVGTNRQQDDRGDFASNLMKTVPPEEIRLACSVAGEFRLHTVLLASQDSADHAHNLKEKLESPSAANSRESSWAQPSAEVINYGTSAGGRETVEELTTLINNVSGEVRKSLDDRCPRPRAILVATLGEKETILPALSAAQNYGAQWGIPVFLVSTVKRNEEEFQFHQFGLHQDAREALLRAARYCMERLDLLSTYRLLTLGDQKMREHAEAAKSLAKALEEAVNAKQIDEHAARIADAYRVIAGFCQSSSDELLRARLATIAGELIFRGRSQDEPVILRRKKGDKSAVKTLKSATREQLLQIIYKVRTETALNHGKFTVDQALEDVLGKRISSTSLPTTTTYSDLLQAAVDKIQEAIEGKPESASSNWKQRFDELHGWIEGELNA